MRTRLALLVALAVMAGAGALALAGPRALASGTVLDLADGTVALLRAGAERSAREGEPLAEGDELRTGDDGHAVILFFDGSTVALEPRSSLRIDVARSDGRATLVDVYQALGTTWHSVQKALDSGSRYQVITSTMAAAVRGTAFQVSAGDEEDDVTTEEGTVEVTAQRATVRVTAGLRTAVRRGAAPRVPEQAARPQRVLLLELIGGTGLIVDRARRTVGAAPDGSLKSAIPRARVERLDGATRILVANPTRELRFIAGPRLRAVHYTLLGSSGQTLASGQATAASGGLAEVFERVREFVPDPTPTPARGTPPPTRLP